MNLDFLVRHSFGVMRTSQLTRCGVTGWDLRQHAREGSLTHPRRGWHATQDADPQVLSAVRAGGVLSCISALRLRGYWVPETTFTHVRLTEYGKYRGSGLSQSKGLVRCGIKAGNRRPATAVDPTLVALSAAAGCIAAEDLVAVIDSVLHEGRVDMDGVRRALRSHPAQVRRLLDYVDPAAESGTESLVRYRLMKRRIKLRSQVRIRGIGRVDLMVGDRLVIEVDSRAHHTGEVAYEKDRRRDRLLVERNYIVIRLTYHQITTEWDQALASILAVIRRRDHLGRLGWRPEKAA